MIYNEINPIDSVQIINRYALFSTIPNDPLFQTTENRILEPIFCGGIIKSFRQNVYNFKINDFVVYFSRNFDLHTELSSNLIFKLSVENNLELITLLPYASFAMKILRKINPKLGQIILLIGLNFFSILLKKLMDLSGAYVYILNLNKSIVKFDISIENEYVINGINDVLVKFKNLEIDMLILLPNPNQNVNDFNIKINTKKKIDLTFISIYDDGLEDLNYLRGVKYPYSYVRWDFRENFKYFIYLFEKKLINYKILNFNVIEVESITDLLKKVKELEKNCLFLFNLIP